MQVLLVSAEFGWPANTGFRQRLGSTARALLELGELTWVVCAPPGPDGAPPAAPPPPADLPATVHVVPLRRRRDLATMVRWPLSRRPWRLHSLDLPAMHAGVRAALAGAGPYDVVLASQLEAWAVVEPLLGELVAPTGIHALDLDDVESHKVRLRARTQWRGGTPGARARAVALHLDARWWQRVIDRALATSTAFTASEEDQARLGGRPLVLRNVVPEPPAGHVRRPSDRPVLVFVGSLTYEPNIDGLEHLVAEVLPAVREAVPGTVLRIVGQGHEPRVAALAAAPGVELVGEVDSVSPELATASVAVVPLRFGGGTRIKILEALAHGVPVVSTSTGAAGLGVVHDEHALLADTPAAFAAACVRLLTDPAAGARLVAGGAALVEAHRGPVVRAGLVRDLRARHAERAASTSR